MNATIVSREKDFNFIAFSFALMEYQGRGIPLQSITAGISPKNKAWFTMRYEHFLEQLKLERISGEENPESDIITPERFGPI